ncbi:MAG: SOS response-associated peptidase family protein [Anaerolineae bacterium]
MRANVVGLADSFFEWKALEKGKQPYYARLANGERFCLCGLVGSLDFARRR